MRASCRHVSVGLTLGVSLVACAPSLNAPQFKAVVIHGGGVDAPFVLNREGEAMCLWFFTYNLYEALAPAPAGQPQTEVIFSFIENPARRMIAEDAVKRARFHTRLLLVEDHLPHVQFQKPHDQGFVSRMNLHPAAEVYFAVRGIPTRADRSGSPMLREFSPSEQENSFRSLRESLEHALPQCSGS